MNFTAIARIDPATAAESLKRDMTLDAGWTFKGTVLGPDGRPLAGAWGIGLTARGEPPGPRPRGDEDRRVHGERVQPASAAAHPLPASGEGAGRGGPAPEEPGRLDHRATPARRHGRGPAGRRGRAAATRCGTGRLPRTTRSIVQPGESVISPPSSKTDQQGRFRIEGLLPGYEFALSDGKGDRPLGEGLRSGETKDLGDVTIGDE